MAESTTDRTEANTAADELDSREGATWEEAAATNAQSPPTDANVDEAPTCRICFDTGNGCGVGRLFSPCECRGSMRYVHVGCLDEWRCSATNDSAYYRCDSCHYNYRLQRTQVAVMLLSPNAPTYLVVMAFVSLAVIFGLLARWLFPAHHAELLGLVFGTLDVHLPDVDEAGGNLVLRLFLWVAHASIWRHPALQMLAQVTFSGVLALALPGSVLYVLRELRTPEGGLRMDSHAAMFICWLSCFSSRELGRIALVVGAAASLRELYSMAHDKSKHLAQLAGERILEVS